MTNYIGTTPIVFGLGGIDRSIVFLHRFNKTWLRVENSDQQVILIKSLLLQAD